MPDKVFTREFATSGSAVAVSENPFAMINLLATRLKLYKLNGL
jgi:hypothetical protein